MRTAFVITLVVALSTAAGTAAAEKGFTPLFNGNDFAGWGYFLRAQGDQPPKLEDVWSVKDGTIHCKGKPSGYLKTDKTYSDYVLKLEWRWPAEPGNSGVLLRTVGEDKIWPKSIEAQLRNGDAGDLIVMDGAKLETPPDRVDQKNPRRRHKVKGNEKAAGEWNEYEITLKKDKLTVKVNGRVLNEGTGAEEVAGKILLQSEGAPFEFRKIRIKELR